MPGLVEALSALGVPDVSEPGELRAYADDLLALVDPTDLESGATVARAAAECAPEFVALAEAAARAGSCHATTLFEAATTVLPTLTSLVFLDAADVALSSPLFLESQGRFLARALDDRIEKVTPASGLQAYAYLEVLTRLGLTNTSARYRALEHLTSVDLAAPEDLLERLPKLIGIAVDCWKDPALPDRLRMLLDHDASRADAAYELAQLSLREALEAVTLDDVVFGLTRARDNFTTVENLEEAREDATLYRCALDLAVSFVSGGEIGDGTETLKTMTTAIIDRAAMTTRSDLGSWAAPRRQAEVEWFALARTLRTAMDPLSAPSWNTPRDALVRVLAAYRASRSIVVMSGDGLQIVLEPTIEAAFIRHEGLLHHLRLLIAEEELPEQELWEARRLLSAVDAPKDAPSGDASGKARAAAPDLAAELGDKLDPSIAHELVGVLEKAPNLLRTLNNGARTRARMKAREADPIVDRLLERVLVGVNGCPGLDGLALVEFIELLTYILRFAADRANIGRLNGGPDVLYLFEPASGIAFTENYLQRDVATWLKATPLRQFVELEQHDVAAGRADITVRQTRKLR